MLDELFGQYDLAVRDNKAAIAETWAALTQAVKAGEIPLTRQYDDGELVASGGEDRECVTLRADGVSHYFSGGACQEVGGPDLFRRYLCSFIAEEIDRLKAEAQAARDLAAKRIGFSEFKRIVRKNS